jgi:hypothetical protein
MNSILLNIKIPSGAPAVAIPKEFHLAVAQILNYLQVGGRARLIKRSELDWTIFVDDAARGDPGLFKVATLIGIRREQTSEGFTPWVPMTVDDMVSSKPTRLRAEAERLGELTALDSYWDYVRAVELPED